MSQIKVTNLTTGETYDVGVAGVLVLPETMEFGEPDAQALARNMVPITYEVEIPSPPDPRVVALMTGDPWMEVAFRQHQQLDALRAMA